MLCKLGLQYRAETAPGLNWVANRLHMGSWAYLSNLLAEPVETPSLSQGTLPLFQ
jgi:hypothetical protein